MPLNLGQIRGVRGNFVPVINFAASGGDDNATSAITDALGTAGDLGTSVPVQVASGNLPGVIVNPPSNFVRICRSSDKEPIADSSNNEVFARLTSSGSTYTLTYYTLVGGAETPYSFPSSTNIDFYFGYRFTLEQQPRDAAISTVVRQDPKAIIDAGVKLRWEELTITSLNVISNLSQPPTAPTNITLYIDSKPEFAFGSKPAFSVSGTAITWNSINAEYVLRPGMIAIAQVW